MSNVNIHVFNPSCEIEIANNSPYFNPPVLIQKFAKDLELLPAYLASENDIISIKSSFNADFIKDNIFLNDRSLKFINKNEIIEYLYKNDITISKLNPWGWSPKVHEYFKDFKEFCSNDFKKSIVFYWNDKLREYFSRLKAFEFLIALYKKNLVDLPIDKSFIPTQCFSEKDVENKLDKYKQIVLKAPWSSSGRGIQVLRKSYLNTSLKQWIKGVLDTQKYIMCEPLLFKKVDFAFQYEIKNNEVFFLGNSWFLSNENGMYQGNIIGNIKHFYNSKIINFITQTNLHEIAKLHIETLKNLSFHKVYQGNLGIDSMIYMNKSEEFKIQPCVEINLRNNMGQLALKLQDYVHPQAKGTFNIYFNKQLYFSDYMILNLKEIIQDSDKIVEGIIPLTPLNKSNFGAYLNLF